MTGYSEHFITRLIPHKSVLKQRPAAVPVHLWWPICILINGGHRYHNSKFNLEFLGDDNPHCKWNANGTSRNKNNIYLGAQSTNLPSDVHKIKGTGNYTMYDLTNCNNLISDNKYNSLPVMFVTSGKEDDVHAGRKKFLFTKHQQNKQVLFLLGFAVA